MVPLLVIVFLVIMGLSFLAWWHYGHEAYARIYNNGPHYSKSDFSKEVRDGIKFVDTFSKAYAEVVDREVHSKFKGEFQLFKKNSIGAKLVVSSFGEALIYVFPNAEPEIIIDRIDFPVQTAFAYGFIDLNNPREKVDLRKVGLKMRLADAINSYNSEPGRITITEGGGGAVFADGGLVFENVHKIFSFQRQTILGLMNSIAFRQSSPHYVQVYGNKGYHDFRFLGLLMISSENTFDWSFQTAKKLGRDMAEIEIKTLLTKSEFFKLSLADMKLRPTVEAIIQKKARSEQDKSYKYPLWEFKKDVFDLKNDATQIGIDSSYVDELLKESSLKPESGTLFFYYQNGNGFMLQWSLMNLLFLIILAALTIIKYGDVSLLVMANKAVSVLGTNLTIISLLTIANGWAFSRKPESLVVTYWILPFILYLSCTAWSVIFSIADNIDRGH